MLNASLLVPSLYLHICLDICLFFFFFFNFAHFPVLGEKRVLHIYHKKCKLVTERAVPSWNQLFSLKLKTMEKTADTNHKPLSPGIHLDSEHFPWDSQPWSFPESSAEQSHGKICRGRWNMFPPVQCPQIFPRPAACHAWVGIHW